MIYSPTEAADRDRREVELRIRPDVDEKDRAAVLSWTETIEWSRTATDLILRS
jgi:hypothetical protein